MRAVAEEKGYTLTKFKKTEIIAEILYFQRLDGAVDGYVLTEDAALDENKTYYARSGEQGAYTFAAVEEPSVDDIAEYYEKLSFWLTEDTALDNEKTYYTRSNIATAYEFTVVASTSLDDIGDYYEVVE